MAAALVAGQVRVGGSAGTGSPAAVTVTLPSATSGGDVLVFIASGYTITGTGFTAAKSGSASLGNYYVFRRHASTGESSWSFTIAGNPNSHVWLAVEVTGLDASTQIDVTIPNFTTATTAASLATNSITTVSADTLLLAAAFSAAIGGLPRQISSWSNSFTAVANGADTQNTQLDFRVALAQRSITSTGTYSTTATFGAGSNNEAAAVILALRSAVEDETPEGGSTATATASATGDGSKTALGASTVAATATAAGAGLKAASGGSLAGAAADATGAGSKTASGGSSAPAVSDASGAGAKTASGGSSARAAATTSGAGSKTTTGASTAQAAATATGAGQKASAAGSTVYATAEAAGDGITYRQGGSTATAIASATGGGEPVTPGVGWLCCPRRRVHCRRRGRDPAGRLYCPSPRIRDRGRGAGHNPAGRLCRTRHRDGHRGRAGVPARRIHSPRDDPGGRCRAQDRGRRVHGPRNRGGDRCRAEPVGPARHHRHRRP